MFRGDHGQAIARGQRPRRIALITDFGAGPYIGQMRLLLAAAAPSLPVIDLIADLTPFRPDLAGYLLPGLLRGMPPGTLYLCVVDPGVGSERGILALRIGSDWLLAPDNGLLVPLLLQSAERRPALFRVDWRPSTLSASFHGRDLFTPIAQRIIKGRLPRATPVRMADLVGAGMSPSLAAVCYLDSYGNAMTGVPARGVRDDAVVSVRGARVARARTFSDVPVGIAFWYENAFGLLEVAVNQGRADSRLGLGPGDSITWHLDSA
ncbi:MAG: hypothetical protein GVY09_00335 [Gammaproteobacteria bacterium]|jgi:S-adenosylmethionine hydrolase|nr:hypothetical protein [Gammaproteobacteria bacterium]